MNGAALLITIFINCLIIYILHVFHRRSIATTVKNLRKEVNELENLVVAIIEEFEEVADEVWRAKPEKPPLKSSSPPDNEPLEPEKLNEEESLEVFAEEPIVETTETTGSTTEKPLERLPEEKPSESIPTFRSPEFIDPKRQRVFELWNNGLMAEEIAKQMGIGQGEVQLILGIYKRS